MSDIVKKCVCVDTH